jgi:hypothetical protein
MRNDSATSIHDLGTVTCKGLLEGWRRRRRAQQQRCELLLSLTRESNDFDFGDGPLGGLPSGRNYKIADRAALDFRGAADYGESLTCDAGFQAGGSSSGSLRHFAPDPLDIHNVRQFTVHVKLADPEDVLHGLTRIDP